MRNGSGHDAIVVGARCAGAPTAMLLAQRGHRVLLVDRASFPSDTVSTNVVHAQGVAALGRWGLLDELVASGCPPIHHFGFDFGPVTITGTPHAPHEGAARVAYAPRRTVLDELLVRAAERAGAQVRERFTVEELVIEDGRVVGLRGHDEGGATVTERARVVIGADGRASKVARAVQAPEYHVVPNCQWASYTYWSGLPVDGMETVIRPGRGWAAIPTNDELTLLVMGCPVSEGPSFKADVEANYRKTLELDPAWAERVARARREERFAGASVPNYFRRPYGPGWALVGDAGHCKDPITAQGISDAFLDAERCAAALDDVLAGRRRLEEAMADHQRQRDERALPMYRFTTQLASFEPPTEEAQQLLAAIAGNRAAMDAFVSVTSGALSPDTFYDPAHLGPLLGGEAAAA
jgi:2-polyprenyl-6-methoxyphenol hydroxylase-like FAD-dependent oxidoreductase